MCFSQQDCLQNLQNPMQMNIWGPSMKKQGETAVQRTKILNIFLSSAVYLWAPPGVLIFYLMSLSLGHRDTPGGVQILPRAVSVHTPASQLLYSPHSPPPQPPNPMAGLGSLPPPLRQTRGPKGIATSAPRHAGCPDRGGHGQLRRAHAARPPLRGRLGVHTDPDPGEWRRVGGVHTWPGGRRVGAGQGSQVRAGLGTQLLGTGSGAAGGGTTPESSLPAWLMLPYSSPLGLDLQTRNSKCKIKNGKAMAPEHSVPSWVLLDTGPGHCSNCMSLQPAFCRIYFFNPYNHKPIKLSIPVISVLQMGKLKLPV